MTNISGAANSSNAVEKKMSKEEIASSANRLYTMGTRKEKQLPPIVKSVKLSKDHQQSSVQRLYHDSIEIARKNQAIRIERHHKKDAVETKKIPEEEVQEVVGRLYEQSVKLKKANIEVLQRKQAAELEKGIGKEKKLSREDIGAMANRLYGEAPQQTREKQAKLYEKYVTDHLPKSKKVTPEDAKEYAERLYKNEKQ